MPSWKDAEEAPGAPGELGKRLDELEHRTNENFIHIEKILEKLQSSYDEAKIHVAAEKRIAPAAAPVSAIPANIESMLRELHAEIRELRKFETKSRLNFFDVEKRMVKLESGEAESEKAGVHTAHGRHTVPELAVKIRSMEDKFEERMKSLEDIIMLLEVELVKAKQKTAIIPQVPGELEERIRIIEEKLGNFEHAGIRLPAEEFAHEPRLRTLEENLLSLETRFRNELRGLESRLLNVVTGGTISEDAAKEFMSRMHEDMRELKLEIEKAKLMKEELAKLDRATVKQDGLQKLQKSLQEQMAMLRTQVEVMIATSKSTGARTVGAELSLKEQFGEYRRLLDAQMLDFEEGMREAVREEARKVMLTEEAEKIVQRLETLEKEVELRAYGIVVKEFESFAEAIDKKFPELVTKRELEQKLAKVTGQLTGHVAAIETPDTTPILERLHSVEERLNELTELLGQLQQPAGAAVVIE